MNSAELQFIIKMRDEASAVLNSLGNNFKAAGSGAAAMGGQTKEVNNSLTALVGKAKEAAAAVTALWTANKLAHQASDAFKDYEAGMIAVSRTTGIAGDSMSKFQQSFDQMAAKVKGVPVEKMIEFAEVAGQLGIRGEKDILSFAETIGKLTQVTNIAGEEGAKQFGRLLLITGEGAKGTAGLANSLAGLSATTKASGQEILALASSLGQTTAGFKLSSVTLTGLAAAAAQLNFEPSLFSNAVGRTLRELKDGALNATSGMAALSQVLGVSREDFKKLLDSDPDQALLKFANAIKVLQADGQSVTGFLAKFNLQGDETQKVLLTMGKNVDEFASKMQEAKNLAGGNSLNDFFGKFAVSLKADLAGASTAWNLFLKNVGEGIAPVLKVVIGGFTSLLGIINMVFSAMPDGGKKLAGWAVIGAPALFGVIKILKIFPGIFAGITAGLATVGRQFGIMGAQATAAAATTATAGTAVQTAATPKTGVMGKVGAVAAWGGMFAGAAAVGDFLGEKIADGLIAYTPDFAKKVDEFMNGGAREAAKKAEEAKKAAEHPADGHGKAAGTPDLGNAKSEYFMSPTNQAALEQYDSITKSLKQIKEAEQALEALREGSRGKEAGKGDARSDEEIARMKGLIEIAKRALDPVAERVRLTNLEIQSIAAVTIGQKNNLEVETAIREEREKKGALNGKEVENITNVTRALQAQREASAAKNAAFELTSQLLLANAVTEAEKQRVTVLNTIAEKERTVGAVVAELTGKMMTAINQANNLNALRSSYDTVGMANRKFSDDVKVLNTALKDGSITGAEYNRMLTIMSQQTLAQRNPFAAQMQTLKEELGVMQVQGDYRDADKKSLQTIIELKKQGVTLTDAEATALANANRQLQDLQKAQSSGVAGWVNGVGSLRDNMMDITKDFASGLSGAISGALKGNKNAWSNFISNMSGKLIDTSVNQLLKDAFTNGSGNAKDGISGMISSMFMGSTPGADGSALNKMAGAITTPSATVNAGVVNVNGSPLGYAGADGGLGGTGVPGMGGGAMGAIEKATAATKSASLAEAGISGTGTSGLSAFGLGGISGVSVPLARSVQAGVVGAAETLKSAPLSNMPVIPGSTSFPGGDASLGSMGGFSPFGPAGVAAATGSGAGGAGVGGVGSFLPMLGAGSMGGGSLTPFASSGFKKVAEAMADPSRDMVKNYIREAAAARGIDPNVAEKVFNQESGFKFNSIGDKGTSFGPMQLHYGGLTPNNAALNKMGMGDDFTKQTGLDARDPSTWQQQVDFGMNNAAKKGWGAWYGARDAKVGKWDGIGKNSKMAEADMPAEGAQNAGAQFPGTDMQGMVQQFQANTGQVSAATQGLATTIESGSGGVGGALNQLTSALSNQSGGGSGLGGLLGGGGGSGGGMGGELGGLWHNGGLVAHGPSSGFRFGNWSGAPRFHSGGGQGMKQDEYRAILQRGERVLTSNDNRRTEAVMGGIAQMNSDNSRPVSVVQNFHGIRDTGGFNRSQDQSNLKTATAVRRAMSRNM